MLSPARIALHALAVLVPLGLAGLAIDLLFGAEARLGAAAYAGAAAVGATQIACLTVWPLLDRQVRGGRTAWWLGAALALLTHLSFPLCYVAIELALRIPLGLADPDDAQALLTAPLLRLGWLSFPLAIVLTQFVATLRRKELLHAPG